MPDLHLHPTSALYLEALQKSLPQSMLLSGEKGVGLETIARWIAKTELADILKPKNAKGEIDSGAGTISVEAIRLLYEATRSKRTTRQIIIIDDAERMSRGAQSAFLKLLEEPNPHTHFILTSHSPGTLLATIRSRLQQVSIQPLTDAQSQELIRSLGVTDTMKQTQLSFIAAGLPAELTRLTGDNDYFQAQAKIVGDARDFLQATSYKKFLVIQKYRSNREGTLQLLDRSLSILRRSMQAKPQPQLIKQLEGFLTARESIAANQSIPLQLGRLVL